MHGRLHDFLALGGEQCLGELYFTSLLRFRFFLDFGDRFIFLGYLVFDWGLYGA